MQEFFNIIVLRGMGQVWLSFARENLTRVGRKITRTRTKPESESDSTRKSSGFTYRFSVLALKKSDSLNRLGLGVVSIRIKSRFNSLQPIIRCVLSNPFREVNIRRKYFDRRCENFFAIFWNYIRTSKLRNCLLVVYSCI